MSLFTRVLKATFISIKDEQSPAILEKKLLSSLPAIPVLALGFFELLATNSNKSLMKMSRWLSEMMDNFPDAFGEDYEQSYSSENISPFLTFNPSPLEQGATQTCFERPTKQLKTTCSWNSCNTEQVLSPDGSSSASMLSFRNSNSPTSHHQYYGISDDVKPKEEVGSPANRNFVPDSRISQGAVISQNYTPKAGQGNKRVVAPSTKQYPCPQDHVIAERKRREKLSQRFIALSTLLPGLKKIDKASVLETSITYIKKLQEQVKTLESQISEKPMESVVFVKKFEIPSDDSSSMDETSTNSSNEPLPEIKTRVSGKNVLIRIHCKKQEETLVNALAEIRKLKVSVVSSSSIPFGSSTLDITILAQMDEEFDMAVKDFVEKLDSSFRQFM